MHPIIEQLLPRLRRLLPPGNRVLVATSGGPDSQVLLDILAQSRTLLGLGGLWAVGIDHGLRPEAGAELDLVEDLATRHGVPFERHAVTLQLRGNLLASARLARYKALRQALHTHGAQRLAVGHTASDQLETLIMNLCRGTTLRGAGGMRQRRGALVRPLLGITRQSVLAYAIERDIPYANDPSNCDPRRARPRLRASVAPALASLNPRYAEHIAAFAEGAQEDEAFLQYLAHRALLRLARWVAGGEDACLDLAAVKRLPTPVGKRALHQWLRRTGGRRAISPSLLDILWRSADNLAAHGQWPYHGGTLWLDRGRLWSVPSRAGYDSELKVPGKTVIPGFPACVTAETHDKTSIRTGHFALPEAEGVAFDADRLHFVLKLRSWQPGDRLRPFGLDGSIKVGDVFTNAKIPRALRAKWPIISHGAEVLWVVGLRRSHNAPLKKQTRHVMTLKLDGALLGSAC